MLLPPLKKTLTQHFKTTLSIVILLVFINYQGRAQSKNFIDKPFIETRAMVDTLVVPDQIYLAIKISEKDTRDRISIETLENKMQRKLTALGINTRKQLMLADASSQFKDYFLRRTNVLKDKSYTLLLHKAMTVGEVIVALESINISNVRLSKVAYSKLESLKLIMRTKAVDKAKRQAEALLKPLGQHLGKALYMSDMNTYNRGVTLYERTGKVRMDSALSAKAAPIDIEFNKIKITCSVSVNFEIQ